MTPKFSDFIPSSLEDTGKNIEVADGNHITAKQRGQVRIKMCKNNGDPLTATLHNVLLAPDLCNGLFSIVTLITLGYTFLFHKCFARCTLEKKKKVWLHYHIVHKGTLHFGVK